MLALVHRLMVGVSLFQNLEVQISFLFLLQQPEEPLLLCLIAVTGNFNPSPNPLKQFLQVGMLQTKAVFGRLRRREGGGRVGNQIDLGQKGIEVL